ncbi:MAG: SLC13 family permease [Alphaproteobacteria bacterium]
MADLQMWLTFAIIVMAIVSFSFDRIPVELTAAAGLVALIIVFVIGPDVLSAPSPLGLNDLLMGFANPALLAVMSLIIVGQGLFVTGALDRASQKLARSARFHVWTMIALVVTGAAVLSAFLNNTPVVVMLIPVMAGLARIRRIATGRVLMTMNYATMLGGSVTLIGSSTNLLVAQVAAERSDLQLTMFDITVPGLVLAAGGLIYVLIAVPRLVGANDTPAEPGESGKQFIAEIVLDADHPLVGTTSRAGLFPGLKHVTVRLLERAGTAHLPPFEDIAFAPGDRIVFGGMRAELAELGILVPLQSPRSDRSESAAPGPIAPGLSVAPGLSIAEAMVTPGSRIAGRSPGDIGIDADLGIHVAAIERRSRMSRQTFADKRLEPGDILLVCGDDRAFDRLRGNRNLIVLERSVASLPARRDAHRAIVIFAAMVVCAATGLVSIPAAALTAAVAMIAFGCLNVRQARRAFDGRIFMLVGMAIAAAAAMEKTGGATFLADILVGLTRDGGPALVLSALFALVAILTNLLSNNATAVLFTPVAISAATSLGVSVEPFVVAVIFAANASFATPVGYQTNLLVMGPGGLRFRDYLVAGGPLVVVVWALFSLFAPWYYGL